MIPGLAEVSPAELTIRTRWGEEVFSSSNYQNDWNGMDPSGFMLPEDTYFYVLRTTEGVKNGFIVIKRE